MSDQKVWLAVRCCCQPTKILGFLSLRASDVSRGEVTVREIMSLPSVRAFNPADFANISVMSPARHSVKIRRLSRQRDDGEMAIYSEERPIEFWRGIEGFVEASNAGNTESS